MFWVQALEIVLKQVSWESLQSPQCCSCKLKHCINWGRCSMLRDWELHLILLCWKHSKGLRMWVKSSVIPDVCFYLRLRRYSERGLEDKVRTVSKSWNNRPGDRHRSRVLSRDRDQRNIRLCLVLDWISGINSLRILSSRNSGLRRYMLHNLVNSIRTLKWWLNLCKGSTWSNKKLRV